MIKTWHTSKSCYIHPWLFFQHNVLLTSGSDRTSQPKLVSLLGQLTLTMIIETFPFTYELPRCSSPNQVSLLGPSALL